MKYAKALLTGLITGAVVLAAHSCSSNKAAAPAPAPRMLVCITPFGPVRFMSDDSTITESASGFTVPGSDDSSITIPKSLCVEVRGGQQ